MTGPEGAPVKGSVYAPERRGRGYRGGYRGYRGGRGGYRNGDGGGDDDEEEEGGSPRGRGRGRGGRGYGYRNRYITRRRDTQVSASSPVSNESFKLWSTEVFFFSPNF